MRHRVRNLAFSAVAAVALAGCSGGSLYVARAPGPPPPPMAYGVVGVRPGPSYVWLDGYYDWGGRSYVWVPGRWDRPPRPRAVWVPGYWQRHGGGQVWITGRWR